MSSNPLSPLFVDYKKLILNSYINVEQAKKFKELGFKQHSKDYWFPNPNTNEIITKNNLPKYILVSWDYKLADWDTIISVIDILNDTYSAYNFEELVSFIPTYIFITNDIVLNDYFLNEHVNEMTITEWLADKYLEILKRD